MAYESAEEIRNEMHDGDLSYTNMSVSAGMCLDLEDALDEMEEKVEDFLEFVDDYVNGIRIGCKILITAIMNKVNPKLNDIETALDQIQKIFNSDMFMYNGVGDYKRQMRDADGNLMYDEQGKPIMETVNGDAWCEYTWECDAILKQLLDDDSAFYNALMETAEERCWEDEEEKKNFFDNLNEILENYDKFKDFICNLGFATNLSIDLSKYAIKRYVLNIEDFKKFINRQIAKLEAKLNEYMEWLNNSPLIQLINDIKAMFECVFGELDCSAIWTAQGLYERILLKCHIYMQADGTFMLDPEFKKSIFGAAEAVMGYCQDVIDRLMKFQDVLLTPIDLKIGAKAFECGQALYPGQVGLDDIRNFLTGKWKKEKIVNLFNTKRTNVIHAFYEKRMPYQKECPEDNGVDALQMSLDDISTLADDVQPKPLSESPKPDFQELKKKIEAGEPIAGIDAKTLKARQDNVMEKTIPPQTVIDNFVQKNIFGKTVAKADDPPQVQRELAALNSAYKTNRYSSDYIINNMRIESDGLVYVDDGCCTIVLNNLPLNDEPSATEFYACQGNIGDNRCMLDEETDEIISATQAAVKCATNPTSKLATKCKQVWELINNRTDSKNVAEKL